MAENKSLGQIAYEAWVEHRDVRALGIPWDRVSKDAQRSWDRAAEGVKAALIDAQARDEGVTFNGPTPV